MKENPLDARNQLRLSYAVEIACAKRVWVLIQRGAAEDASLCRFLENQAAQRTGRAWFLRRRERRLSGAPGTLLSEADLASRVASALPSLAVPLGECPVNREIALHFLECLEDECAAFYRKIASEAETDPLRRCFVALMEKEASELLQLRSMVL
jgi:hypothetical protein